MALTQTDHAASWAWVKRKPVYVVSPPSLQSAVQSLQENTQVPGSQWIANAMQQTSPSAAYRSENISCNGHYKDSGARREGERGGGRLNCHQITLTMTWANYIILSRLNINENIVRTTLNSTRRGGEREGRERENKRREERSENERRERRRTEGRRERRRTEGRMEKVGWRGKGGRYPPKHGVHSVRPGRNHRGSGSPELPAQMACMPPMSCGEDREFGSCLHSEFPSLLTH